MNHTMTLREKILLAVLGVLIVLILYIQFFQKPIQSAIDSDNQTIQQLQSTIDVETVRAAKLKQMKQQIADENLQNGNSSAAIPEYNNLKNVMTQLSAILTPAKSYDITFKDTTEKDKLVYRPLEIDITCNKFSTAKTILESITKCPYRCSIDSIDVATAKGSEDPNVLTEQVNVKVAVTFYEMKKKS